MDCRVKVRIGDKGNYFFGPGVAELLRAISECGSVRQAAASMELSYSKAWHMIKNSEDGFGRTLVERTAGGKGGGTATLTEDGRKVMELFYTLEEKIQKDAEEEYLAVFGGYI